MSPDHSARWTSGVTCCMIFGMVNRTSVSLLMLRVVAGGLMFGLHGWDKLSSYSERAASFPDLLGIGGALSFTLVVFAEFFCAAGLVVGFLARLCTIPLIITMAVAAFVAHAGDPFQKKELALLYLASFLFLLVSGPGKLSVDGLRGKA